MNSQAEADLVQSLHNLTFRDASEAPGETLVMCSLHGILKNKMYKSKAF